MRWTYPRTAVAAVLTLSAIAVPCAAWFYAGYQQLEQEAELRDRGSMSKGYKSGVVLAERLATRFEVLRESESRRPFYHYQNLFHDPKGAAEGLSVSVSPLAEGPSNPMIEAHFQIDESGHLSLPTLNDEFPDLGLHSSGSTECEILWKLQAVAVFSHLESPDSGLAEGSRWPSIPWTEEDEPVLASFESDGGDGSGVDGPGDADPREDGPAASSPDRADAEPEILASTEKPNARDLFSRSHLSLAPPASERTHTETLSVFAWEQHLNANALYADLKYGTHAGAAVAGRRSAESEIDTVQVRVGPIGWHTLPVGDEPRLVALRSVETPIGTWAQGFVVSDSAVRHLLDSSNFPAAFEPWGEAEQGAGTLGLSVDGTPWQVTLDLSAKLYENELGIAAHREQFLKRFALGALGAGLAGLLVVAMVFQSERLAQQRAHFAAAAAHELRTPLAGLRLYGEMLAEGLGDPERSNEYARRMAGEAERLGRVVTNVLSFTRLERSGVSVHPQVGDLEQAVREAYQRQRLALEESGAKVHLDLDPDLPPIAFDRDAVTHIVQNLLDNAEKYTREIDGREIVMSLSRESKNVVLSVADNGRGVSKPLRRRLFRPFSRGSNSDAPEGLGLGLVLVRMLARAQGAEISYADAPSGGADFRVAFPVPGETATA